MITVRALGGTQVLDENGKLVRLRSRKHVGLLLYLLSNGRKVHTRSRLCSLFWTTERDRARHSLSQGLYDLRRALGPIIRRVCGHDISIELGSVRYDVLEFEEAARTDDLAKAVEIYKGGFAENLVDAATPEFERWLDSERIRLSRLSEAVLRRHVAECESRGLWGSMCAAALKLATVAPYDMSVHSDYVRALWHQGDAAAALSHCERIITDVGSEQSRGETAAIKALAKKIRANTTDPRPMIGEESRLIDWDPSFVGRDEEFKALRKMVAMLRHSPISRVIIRGEAGIGKSRLVSEFCDGLSLEPLEVVRSRCYQAEEDLPYSPIVDAIKLLVTDLLEGEPTIRERFVRLPYLVSELRIGDKQQQHDRVDPAAWRHALYEEVAALLRLVTNRRPLVWVVDDVQWIDRASGALLHYLCRRLVEEPFLLVLTVRESRDINQSAVSPIVTSEQPGDSVRELSLAPLPEERICEIVSNAAPDNWDHPAKDLAVRLSSGNPYYALEVLAAAVDSHEWAKSASDWDPLNDDRLRKVLEARLGGLGTERIRLLQAVAVLERFARPRLVCAVLDLGLDEAAALSEALYTQSLIQDDGSRIEFVNDTMREFVYGEMTALQRASLHLRAGRILEGEPDATAGALATHFQHGDDWLRSFGYAMEAAQIAQNSAGHSEAAHFADIAVQVAPGTDEQQAALKIRADSSLAAGELAQAASCYARLLRLPDSDPKSRARTALQLANVETSRCNWSAAAEYLVRAWELCAAVDDEDEKISLLAAHSELALKLAFLSDDPEAARESEEPINELVRRVRNGDHVSQATAFSVLSTKAIQEAVTGSSEEALVAITEAEAHLTGTTQYERMRYYSFRGYVRSKLAQWDGAEADLLCSLEAARATGDLLARIRLCNNLACLATERGQWSRSTDRIEEAIRLQATLTGRSDTSLSITLNRANLCFYQGLLAQAADLYRQAGELCEVDCILGTQVEVHSCLGLIALQRNRLSTAHEHWEQVQELRYRDGIHGGTQERFKYAWFASWMLQAYEDLRDVAAQERTRDVPSYAKLQWLAAVLNNSDDAARHKAEDLLNSLDMIWFASFSMRWRRHAVKSKSA